VASSARDNPAVSLQLLYGSFKAHGQDHTHQFIMVRSARTCGVTSSTISSLLCTNCYSYQAILGCTTAL